MAFDVLGIIAAHPPIMVPEVGGSRADVTRETAEAMRVAAQLLERFEPETVVVMSPHAPTARDAFVVHAEPSVVGDLGDFGAAQVRYEASTDTELARAIIDAAVQAAVPAFDRSSLGGGWEREPLDHGVLVPMSFLDPDGRYPVVVLSLSFLPLGQHVEFGKAIARAAENVGRKVAFVASGDCSHRLSPEAPAGFSPRAREFDDELVRHVEANDLVGMTSLDPRLVSEAGECGLRSFATLGGFLEWTDATSRVLTYEAPWGVGYMTAVAADPEGMRVLDALLSQARLTPPAGRKGGAPGADETEPVKLARKAIEQYVMYGEVLEVPKHLSALMHSRAGAFVSLHLDGSLRGCIGTICPTQETLAQEIVRNAIEAATDDPRFHPLTPYELDGLDVKVDVLHPSEACEHGDLDPKEYGVIVSCDRRRGLLLPDLEGVETAEDQVAIAKRKAGIAGHEEHDLERFKVDRYT